MKTDVMLILFWWVWLSVWNVECHIVGRSSGSGSGSGLECEYYNSTCLSSHKGNVSGDPEHCRGREKCLPQHVCYVVWNNVSSGGGWDEHESGVDVLMMGCFETSSETCNSNSCVGSRMEPSTIFCCCNGASNCNSEFEWDPTPVVRTPSLSQRPPTSPTPDSGNLPYLAILYITLPILVIVSLLAAAFFLYKQKKEAEFSSLSTGSDLESPERNPPPTPQLSNRPIELLEVKARGRYGSVWKGISMGKVVAVKIFPLQDKQSWYAEQAIYNLPRMSHENILQFLGVEKRGEGLIQEFWLTTTFHEQGSLCDYLKSNTVSWEVLCRIAESMARGLTHLHEEIPGLKSGTLSSKPAIAHRDFKSKNVLIKSDMTACIGDFGLALVFEPGKSCGDTHGQVGTRRYMAPEVLEGAINFSRDAFLRIDMYACGLVLWELVSRLKCTNIIPEEYKLPFEAEANHPSLEEMQELVCIRKIRPKILSAWRTHPGLNSLCDTIEECWDHDAEARLSSSCVTERIKTTQSYSMQNSCLENDMDSSSTPFLPVVANSKVDD
ncbi:activin receptor type-2B [Lepeophtheirus salmonis]|uniref:activin receptor type-2B n=1 Tax=Lepeophtheirus salmonis TaxID=72036 RepID=UPI001AE949F5|nr:activin receptor type-2A-like [Lepeophtheirus salmonis]